MGPLIASSFFTRWKLPIAGLTLFGTASYISFGPSLFEFSLIKNEYRYGDSESHVTPPFSTTSKIESDVDAEFRKLREENQNLKARVESLEVERSAPEAAEPPKTESVTLQSDQQDQHIVPRIDHNLQQDESSETPSVSATLTVTHTTLKPIEVIEQEPPKPPDADTIEEAQSCYRLARQALQDGDTDSALRSLDSAIAINPEAPLYWYLRGFVHHKAGQLVECQSDYRAGAELETIRSKEISGALEQLQGEGRGLLERFRPRLKKAPLTPEEK